MFRRKHTAAAAPRLSVEAWFERFAWRWAHKRELEGVPVGVFLLGPDEREAAFENIGRALAILRRYSPRRFAHLRRDVRCVLVDGNGEYRGRWYDELRLCQLKEAFVLGSAPADVASTLVHEAMHARLFCRGFGYGKIEERGRVEAACYRAQRSFARRLPWELGREALAAEADAWVRALEASPADVAEQYFSNDAYVERQVKELRDTEVPEWLVRALVAWGERRRQRPRR